MDERKGKRVRDKYGERGLGVNNSLGVMGGCKYKKGEGISLLAETIHRIKH